MDIDFRSPGIPKDFFGRLGYLDILDYKKRFLHRPGRMVFIFQSPSTLPCILLAAPYHTISGKLSVDGGYDTVKVLPFLFFFIKTFHYFRYMQQSCIKVSTPFRNLVMKEVSTTFPVIKSIWVLSPTHTDGGSDPLYHSNSDFCGGLQVRNNFMHGRGDRKFQVHFHDIHVVP